MTASARGRLSGGALLGGIGLGTFLVHVDHMLSEGENVVSLLTGVFFPMLTSAALVLAGLLVLRGTVGAERVDRVVGWSLGGMVWLGLLALVTFLYLQSEGDAIGDQLYVAVNFLSVGGATGFLLGVYDERVQLRTRQLHDREAALERQNETLERFASVVSHDLRNPINVAQGRLELARDDADPEHLDAVERALDRMESLVEDLLTLAREGESVHAPVRIDLASLARESWQSVETSGAGLEVATGKAIRGDERRVQELLENLFRNAVEHGGPDVTVAVGGLDDGFYVEDDGAGIPAAERERVFESGYSTNEGGTGLGLAIVAEIADAHGWSVDVVDGDAGGSRFEVTGVDVAAPEAVTAGAARGPRRR